MAVYEDDADGIPLSRKAGQLVNYAGAAVSLGLMVGVGVWGYQLIMRDVTGIPVVRAMEGAMRVAPENPGGEVAAHTGLAVNAVAAVGEAAPPEDMLVLAPETQGLAAEDLDAQPMAEADEVRPVEPVDSLETPVAAVVTDEDLTAPDAPLDADDILALADQIAAGVVPLTDLADGEAVAPTVMVDGQVVEAAVASAIETIATDIPGVSQSLRPVVRPVALRRAEPATAPAPAAIEAAVNSAALPVGTKLVQLGAFPTPEGAATEWTRLMGRFGEYMDGKERLIQEASTGGQTFYRLRAMGFADLSDARRFCASLDAGGAACIPVVVR